VQLPVVLILKMTFIMGPSVLQGQSESGSTA
jgi:hypothetical protein